MNAWSLVFLSGLTASLGVLSAYWLWYSLAKHAQAADTEDSSQEFFNNAVISGFMTFFFSCLSLAAAYAGNEGTLWEILFSTTIAVSDNPRYASTLTYRGGLFEAFRSFFLVATVGMTCLLNPLLIRAASRFIGTHSVTLYPATAQMYAWIIRAIGSVTLLFFAGYVTYYHLNPSAAAQGAFDNLVEAVESDGPRGKAILLRWERQKYADAYASSGSTHHQGLASEKLIDHNSSQSHPSEALNPPTSNAENALLAYVRINSQRQDRDFVRPKNFVSDFYIPYVCYLGYSLINFVGIACPLICLSIVGVLIYIEDFHQWRIKNRKLVAEVAGLSPDGVDEEGWRSMKAAFKANKKLLDPSNHYWMPLPVALLALLAFELLGGMFTLSDAGFSLTVICALLISVVNIIPSAVYLFVRPLATPLFSHLIGKCVTTEELKEIDAFSIHAHPTIVGCNGLIVLIGGAMLVVLGVVNAFPK